MADLKISQLTSATTPLAGTEVLPLVQSGSTKKVATDDLTVKNLRSNATTGILQVAGPSAAATRTMTVPDANFTIARADAANSFTGDQTLANGNLVPDTSGKGIDFSATPNAPGMTSEVFNDYEEGTWTPSVGLNGFNGTPAVSSTSGTYTKVGRMVTVHMILTFGASTYPGYSVITGLPFTPVSNGVGMSTGSNPGAGAQGGTVQTNTSGQVVWWPSFTTTASNQWHATVSYFV